MPNFKSDYIKLLRRQVGEEINYLKCMGHRYELIAEPCIFCYEAQIKPVDRDYHREFYREYQCNRITHLTDFLSELNTQESSMRRPIGQEVKPPFITETHHSHSKSQLQASSELLPPMPVNLKF